MHVRSCSTCALSRLQLHRNSTFTDTAFLLAGSASAAALYCSAHTLWIFVTRSFFSDPSPPAVMPLPSDMTEANFRRLVDAIDSYSIAHARSLTLGLPHDNCSGCIHVTVKEREVMTDVRKIDSIKY